MERPPLYVLAGGASRRFGSDKARALRGGRPLICGVVDALRPAIDGAVVVAARPDAYADLGLTTIGDRVPGLGPLGGLATALHDLGDRYPDTERLLLAACDLLDPEPGWVGDLTAIEGDAVAFRGVEGWEPLFAVYHRSLFAVAERRLGGDDRSLQGLLDAVAAHAVPVPAGLRQANRPDDL